MAAEESDTLKLYWDHFFKAETGTYEKSTWLDLFLAEFLIRINEGANPKDLIKFCPISGVVTLVGCELLCGIHRVTSSVTAHCSVPLTSLDLAYAGKKSEDVDNGAETETKSEEVKSQPASLFTRNNAQSSEAILKKYLLGGVAWKCLVLLKALGVEGLSCCRQLSSVLTWLFGELSSASTSSEDVRVSSPTPVSPRTPIYQLFSHRIWAKQKPAGLQGTSVNSPTSSEKGAIIARSRHPNTNFDTSEKAKRKLNQKTDESSESADSNDDLQVLNRSLTIKVCTANDDFEYFNSPIRSSNDYPNDSFYTESYNNTPRKIKVKAENFMTDRHRQIINSEITSFEFIIIITDLLQELCKAESSLSGSEGSQISVQCVNFSLKNLCSLQFSSVPIETNQNNQSRIKVALTELLIVSLDKVLIHSDLCAKLINNGILPMLLRVLEDVITKCNKNRAKDLEKTDAENLLKFIFGTAYSVTAFFHCLLMQCRSIEKLREFTDQFKLYGDCLKGGLLKECVELMIRIPGTDEEEAITSIKKLIESIGKLINAMKRVRSEVIHSAACPRSRHKVCRQRVAAGMHHHHDILGEASTSLPKTSACCVSVLYGTLTSLLPDERVSAQPLLRNKILRVMLNCGVCCCFSPGLLMESIVRLMLTHNNVASLCLQVLEHTVYGDLGASILIPKITDQLPCSICEPCDDRKELGRKYCPLAMSPIERKSVWSFLIHYNSLLQLDNHNNVLYTTVSHLLRVTPKCRSEMKYELLFSVIYPTFIVAKHRYIMRLEESAYFLTVSCLNIFSSLLNTVPFAEQFIQKGGLSYVVELVSLPEFSNQCCSILEIAIIVEIFKLTKENSTLTYFREMSSLFSVQMLFKSLSDTTKMCYRIYKKKLPLDKFEELCDVTKERRSLMNDTGLMQRKFSIPKPLEADFDEPSKNVVDDTDAFKNIWTFWKTCAGLCLYSPMFREYMVTESVFLESFALLKLVLHYLCNFECSAGEMRILIKIMEALLTVQFSVSDVTSGRSKETSCVIVRGAIAAPAAVLEVGGGLRAMCEALIRVATAEPSRHHVMPRLPHAKVPALVCASGNTSAECSSSEESAAPPYGSEHSEPSPQRPDEGYEADVEIGKLDISECYRIRKISSMSTVTTDSGLQSTLSETMNMECGEYTKNGELAHPELCVIVVDILTQLIHKLVTSKRSKESNAQIERVGAQLARACCARLTLCGARAPPPLLHRLLAPAHAPLLAHAHHHLQDLQRSVLELIYALASQSISPSELALFLRLMCAPSPPLQLLLSTLQRLLGNAQPNTPDCILTFPIEIHTENRDGLQSMAEELSHLVLNNATSQSHLAENCARNLHEAHLRAGIRSVWSVGAARCGAEGAGWAPWLHGFALALWIHRPDNTHSRYDDLNDINDESSDTEAVKKTSSRRETTPVEPLHVVSLGHESLMFELWLDTSNGVVTARVSRPEPGASRVLSEGRVASALPPARWTHFALNLTERVYKRHIYIQVTAFVNGYACETVSLPIQGVMVRKASPTHIVVGHAARAGARPCSAYHLASVQVYRQPLFTPYSALHLTAHGPDHSCQVRCESPNYPLIVTPNVLDTELDWDQVYEISASSLRELHENLLLSFSANAPHIMNLYHQTAVLLPTVLGAGGAAGGGGGGPCIPETLFPVWTGGALHSRHRGLAPALFMLGGPHVLLYLYARVVELEGSGAEQAMALGILLRACRVDNRLYSMFYSEETTDMLLTVFASPKCRITHHLLEVIVNESCSSPVVSRRGDILHVSGGTDAVVLEPSLFLLLMKAWRHLDTQQVCWEVEGGEAGEVGAGAGVGAAGRGSLWGVALRCVVVLLRGQHPRRTFNHYQLNRVGLLTHLLLACKERFLNSECGPLDDNTSTSFVELVRGLMGSPPLLHQLALLSDFLLLMHQASDTFVTHSRANFYFLLTSDTQDVNEFTFKRKPPKRTGNETEPENPTTTPTTTSTEDVDSSLNTLKDLPVELEGDKIDNSVESTKQMKGIINMQIREVRKQNMSSTSENSDTTTVVLVAHAVYEGQLRVAVAELTEGSGGSAGERTEEELNEYIVVDVEEVNHTTVEMFTGGIYHQRRVRAGAAPGWSACEGLLTLLRDIIGVLTDHALVQAVCGAVQPEWLVVVGNHREAGVRARLVRVFAALQRRAPPDVARRLRQQHFYLHLANQISLYEGSWELAAACAALLTKCDVPLEDQLDDDIWVDVTEEAVQRSPPLLALLPSCLGDVPLAHNITLLIRRVIEKASIKVLNEVSVAEVVVRCVRAVGLMPDTEFEGRDLLLEDLYELLNRLAIKALSTNHSMQTIAELHHMLSYVERNGAAQGAVRSVARAAQRSLFGAQLEWLEQRLRHAYAPHHKHNYFATVLTSAVSLGEGGGELGVRLLATVSRGVAFLASRSPRSPHSTPEELLEDAPLFDRLINTLLSAVSGSSPSRGKWWAGGGGDWVTPLQELFWWAGSPAPGTRLLQPRLLRALYSAPPHVLQLLTPQDPPGIRKLAVYLLRMLKRMHGEAESGPAPVELAITDWARGWAVATQATLPDRLHSESLALEALSLLRSDEARWARATAKASAAITKVVFSKDGLAGKVTESAMCITRQVVEVQNGERKAFMEHLRREQAQAVAAAARWRHLVDQYTHEHAVWHDPRSYPTSWELDDTEGPGRVRVRLRRTHLNIHPKFLKPQHRHKAEACRAVAPLRGVVGSGTAGGAGARGGLVARLQLHETVSYMASVTHVTVATDTRGELLLTDRCIHFVPEDPNEKKEREGNKERKCKSQEIEVQPVAESWPLESVVQVVTRRWCLQELAVELFLSSGHAQLLAFDEEQERGVFLKALAGCHLPCKIEPDTLTEAMTQWRNGTITNWEYVMRLNGLAGRSYNDLMQYPVLPFVIADYASKILDLNNPTSFRDLTRPMAIQNKNREQHYINVYNDLKAARREGCSPLLSRQPHHYASLYSNSGGVLHYLVRLPPFTSLFLNYQDNNFDMPDRTFHSMATTWRLITNDSPTDVKELIPELFYLPELFHNNEGLNLGVRQCGAPVDEVELPPWAADARLFTLIHRQALESAHVTENLPHWLDLVFGYKQTGQPAIDAINVFPACTYYGFDPGALEEEVDRTAASTMVRTYGQAPRQLLRHPHPHAHRDLLPTDQQVGVWAGVEGARWGRYCGSPALTPPAVTSRRTWPGACALHALPHARSVALATRATALVALHGEMTASHSQSSGQRGALALVSWGHSDNIVRLKRRRDTTPHLLLHVPALDQITKVSSSCTTGGCPYPLFLGHASGRVLAVRVRSSHAHAQASPSPHSLHGPHTAGGSTLRVRTRLLQAHAHAITDVHACARATLLVTASVDGLIVLWDLNKLTYIRTLPNRDMLSVTHVCISETLCDVASVHDIGSRYADTADPSADADAGIRVGEPREGVPAADADTDAYEKNAPHKYKSLIRVHTCNGNFVGSVKVSELVTCVCYSGAPEGVSVNCIAAGLSSGAIRLYSSWDLRPLLYIPPPDVTAPLLSIKYSSDNMVLFGCYGDGTVVSWESGLVGRPAPVRILPATALC